MASTTRQTSPVRASVPTGSNMQAKQSAKQKSETRQSGGKMVPWRRYQRISGMIAIPTVRSEEHTSELQSLMRISYAVFCLKKKRKHTRHSNTDESYVTSNYVNSNCSI